MAMQSHDWVPRIPDQDCIAMHSMVFVGQTSRQHRGVERGEGGRLASRFRVQYRRRTGRRLGLVFMLSLGLLGLFELYRWIVPFDTLNPLWVEATIGQPIIDNWRYGGQDAEGYLKFYDANQTVLLPPDSHLFDANGWFVVIERHTPSSITFAQPYNAIPLGWFAIGGGIAIVPIGYVFLRIRARRGFSSRQRTGVRMSGPFGTPVRGRMWVRRPRRRPRPGQSHESRQSGQFRGARRPVSARGTGSGGGTGEPEVGASNRRFRPKVKR